MNFFAYVAQHWERIAFLLFQHVQVVLIAVLIATALALALTAATERTPRLRGGLLSLTGTLLTIPSFALFGLLIPLFGLGVTPTILALTVYAVFPIFRNAVTGLDSVDPGVVDAARGMGMGATARMLRVRLPLAWPVILNGIRVATIMVVATAAIGAAVNGPGLGELIFRGLARMGGANALNEALSGVVAIVIVAAVLDLMFIVIRTLTTPRGLHV
ncbi:ABC transporter permease [Sediminivirga luteola]|jgi:osmoprotectant transport system permease protein|uniref:ABC transporter permease n=1 Tax=Sediminivirga luteola TaxID=1774748 RepID=A0A8J2U000_9MICO|nr:ABC transporter permease [Sediminivirga luteola]MCI2265181.1 ABC transporter permease [Sediminivirga luteola]GGA22314.1 ABC transporter permease [Sediminivirga luteola]